jgi:tetratricopeptide (TPR) repeat protein
LDVASGALLLARTGELHPKSLTGFAGVLVSAADEAARRGDEGRARAFYELAKAASSPTDAVAEHRASEHLRALEGWESSTQSDGTMQSASSRTTSAVKRALVSRDAAVVNEAEREIVKWVERAIDVHRVDAPIQSIFDHDERTAARLVYYTGVQTMIALHLRDGNAAAALAALDDDAMAAIREPRFVTGLLSAAEGDADAWFDWYRLYQSALEEPEFFDSDLARAAQWGIAVELLRADGGTIASALPMITLLNQFGMPDVGPALLAPRIKPKAERAEPTELQARQAALGLVFRSLETLERRNDIGLARRVFENVEPLLSAWGSSAKGGDADKQLSAVDFYETMGALEVRGGNLERALPLLQKANTARPSVETLRLLASIERQRGQLQQALALSQQLQQLAARQQLPVAESQGLLLTYDIQSELRKGPDAAATLGKALALLLSLRQQPTTPRLAAAIERNLAQVLERYGQFDAARRANERARSAAVSDEAQLSDVLLDEARRSLTYGELSHGRLALRHALEVGIESSSLLYAALWQQLLELRVRAVSDGTVEEAFSRLVGEPGWIGVLASWATGRIDDESLVAKATSDSELVEAKFYGAMRQYAASPSAASKEQLQTVAHSPAIELIEVRIARDLTNQPAAGAWPVLPPNTILP